ncbi:MAG: DUF2851 family protein [Verrucomicrobiales bacterium]
MSTRYPVAADRYDAFRSWLWSQGDAVLREAHASPETELEIQARWFGGEFGRTFTGIDGEEIRIVQFGHWNRAAGPDFTEAAVEIDGELKTGPVEIDLHAKHWESHGHGENREFDEVVLHVFTDAPSLHRFFTRTSDHRRVCQLQLPQYAWSQGPPDFLPEAFPGRCVAPLSAMTDEEVESLLLAAAQYRLRRKSARLGVMKEASSLGQSMFQAVAEALGFRQNKTAMSVLAQRCPIRSLLALDEPDREARLFGAAGFLDQETFSEARDPASRTYLRDLWDRWWKMRDEVEPSATRRIPWRFAGNRPVNHPQRRVGALASIVNDWESFSAVWQVRVNNLEKIVNNSVNKLSHPYWERHYTLRSDISDSPLRLVGKDRCRDLLGNVIFPGLVGVEPDLWDEYRALRNVDTNQKLRRAALRLFGKDAKRQKLFTSYYHQQQGLLQIYRDFCLEDASGCEHCPFPEQLAQWSGKSSSVAI